MDKSTNLEHEHVPSLWYWAYIHSIKDLGQEVSTNSYLELSLVLPGQTPHSQLTQHKLSSTLSPQAGPQYTQR